MSKGRSESKAGLSISCFNIPDIFIDDKLIAKHHFQKFGKVARIILRPKRKHCAVEFDNPDSAKLALNESGNYEGQKFRVAWTKHKSETTKEIRKKEKSRDWLPDSEVLAELEAMKGFTLAQTYSPRSEAMALELPISHSKKSIPKKTPIKPVRQWKSEKVAKPERVTKSERVLKPERVAKPDRIAKPEKVKKQPELPTNKPSSINAEHAGELMKIILRQAESSEEKYRVLDARDKLIRLKMVRQSNLKNVARTIGICPDMCPEKERLMREAQHQVAVYEQIGGNKNSGMNHALAVKQYSRSSADQESPLAHELRPVKVLQLTMGYLLHRIMDLCDTPDVNLAEWFHFLWDRTRGIRKDITQQELCCLGSVRLIEQCARFHVHCSARLVSEDVSVFDQKINTENLTKCLQTLKYMYHDLAIKGVRCPNEAEFRGYIVLLNLNDGNFMWEVQQLSREIQESAEVKFALQVHSALDKNNYVRFFKCVQSTTYLNACILLRYFNQVRLQALRRILKSYSPRQPYTHFPVAEITIILAFEDDNSTIDFLEYYGLSMKEEGTHVVLDRKMFHQPDLPFQNDRAIKVIESKRTCSVGEVVCGTSLPPKDYKHIIPHNSFNNDGTLKSSEIPSDWESKYNERSLIVEDTNSKGFKDETDSQKNEIVTIKSTEPKFTFCLPSNTDFKMDVSMDVPVTNTMFQFQSPENLVFPLEKTQPIFVQQPIIDQISTNINIFNKTDMTFVSKENNKTTYQNIFKTADVFSKVKDSPSKPIIQKDVSLDTYKLPIFTNNFNSNNIFSNIPKPLVSSQIPVATPKLPPTIFHPLPQKITNETFETNLKEKEIKSKPKEKQEVKRQRKMDESDKISSTNIKIPVEEPPKLNPKKVVKVDNVEVKKVLNKIIDDVERKTEIESKLREISDKIKKKKIINYVNKWRNIVRISKRKRKTFFDNPVWISPRSVTQEAKELFTLSQNLTLHNMKRYKRGTTSAKLPNIKCEKILKLNIYNIVWKILFEKYNSFGELSRTNIFWKISVSLTIDNSYSSNCLENFIFESFDWKIMNGDIKTVKRCQTRNGGSFAYCIENIKNTFKNDLNGLLFIVDVNLFQTFFEKISKQFTKNRTLAPIIIIIINSAEKNNSIIERFKNLVEQGCIDTFEVVFTKGSITAPIITAALQWLSYNLPAIPPLQMDALPTLLRTCAGEEFWNRINSSAKINKRLHILLRDPNITIHLYNKAIDYLSNIICDKKLHEFLDFPLEFKDFISDDFIVLPCTYEYFPQDWKKIPLNKMKSVLNNMKLPEFLGNWPPNNPKDFVKEIEQYSDTIFNNSNVFIKIINVYSNVISSNEENFIHQTKTIIWSDILEIIIREKINNIDENDMLMAVYKIDDLKELCKIPWWYTTTEISNKIKTVTDEVEDEDLIYISENEDSDNFTDINDTIAEVTELLSKENDKNDDVKKDFEDLTFLMDDIEESIKIQRKIMMKFNETANLVLNDTG